MLPFLEKLLWNRKRTGSVKRIEHRKQNRGQHQTLLFIVHVYAALCSISCLQSSLRVLIRYVTRRISATPQSRWVQAPMKRYRMARDDLNWNKASKSIRGLDNQTESSLDKWGRIDRGGAGLEWVLQRTEDQASSF